MKVITSLLDKFLNRSLSSREYHDIFTKLGYEVEEFYPVLNSEGIVLTKTLECKKHPNADSLSHCKIQYEDEILDVVCGGANVKSDQWVIYAPVDSKVGDITLTRKDLRGIESNGMILSIPEITNIPREAIESTAQHNILEASETKIFNKTLEEFLYESNLDGYVFDITILPDRQYATNYFTLAKEISAFMNLGEGSKIFLDSVNSNLEPSIAKESITLGDKAKGVLSAIISYKTSPKTPQYIKNILYMSNIKVKNNIIDIINFVHVITGNLIYLAPKTKEISLLNNFLTLSSLKHNVDLLKTDCDLLSHSLSEYEEQELNLIGVVSSFNINPMSIQGLDPNYGLKFSRGTNQAQSLKRSISRLIKLLLKHGYIEYYSNIDGLLIEDEPVELKVDVNKLKQIIGFEFELSRAIKILTSLGFEIKSHEDYLLVNVPTYRKDVQTNQHFVEEVVRSIGTDKIIAGELLKNPNPIKMDPFELNVRNIFKVISEYQFFEAKNYFLDNGENVARFNLFDIPNELILKSEFNFLNDTYRLSLMNSLIENFVVNYKIKQDEKLEDTIPMFEIANIFAEGYHNTHLGMIIDDVYLESTDNPALFLKELLMSILSNAFKITKENLRFEEYDKTQELFNPYNSIKVFYKETLIAVIGEVHPKILRENKLIRLDKVKRKLFYLEFRFNRLNG